jgi:KaiC/GvpD/RAD55 family RecA-like ATPase
MSDFSTKNSGIELQKEFPDELVSRWILNKIFHEKIYLSAVAECFDERWFRDEKIALCSKLCVTFYLRHETVPTADAIIGNIRYLAEKGRLEGNPSEYIQTFNEIITEKIDVPDDCVREAIELFIRDAGSFQAITRFASRELELNAKKKDKITLEDTLQRMSKFASFRIDYDIGLDYFSDLDSHFKFLTDKKFKRPTGIKWIDDITKGGIPEHEKNLCLFQASTNVGKSVFLANTAYQSLCYDRTVCIITMEMSENTYARRIDSLISEDCIDTLDETAVSSRAKIDDFFKNHAKSKLIIKEYPENSVTVGTIDSFLESLSNDGIKVDTLVVDYITLIKPSFANPNEKDYLKIDAATKELRALSMKYDMVVWSAVQSNRSGMQGTESQLSDMARSTGPAETADFVIGLYTADDDSESGNIQAKVSKSRFCPHPLYHTFHMDKQTLKIDDADISPENSSSAQSISTITASMPDNAIPLKAGLSSGDINSLPPPPKTDNGGFSSDDFDVMK